MKKESWKKRLLCAGLTLAMLVSLLPGSVAGTGQTSQAAEPMRGQPSYRSLISHDYDAIKAALESDGDYYIRLDGDVEKTLGKVMHGGDALEVGCKVALDVLTVGFTEILWNDSNEWRPYYVSETGHVYGGSYRPGSDSPDYLIKLGGGYKVLELDGHDFLIDNPDLYKRKSTLFQVNEGTDFTVKDDKDQGEVFYNGYIFDSSDYEYFQNQNKGDMQRDIIEVNGGSFTLNGGTIDSGRSKNESGFVSLNAQEKGSSELGLGNGYTGSATKYVNGTAIVLKSGEVTINKGTLVGRGFEKFNTSLSVKGGHLRNGVIEADYGTLTINDCYVKAKGSADCMQISDFVDVTVRAGKFSLHRNDALLCGDDGVFYVIDAEPTYGYVGLPESALNEQTWIEYNSNYATGRQLVNSSNWREEFDKNVENHHAKGDYEPWICVYPDGGWGKLTAVADPTAELPEVNPDVKGQMYFAYELESAFSFIPEEVRRTGGWKREYEFMLFSESGKQLNFTGLKNGMSQKASFGKDEYNLGYTLEYNPGDYSRGPYFKRLQTITVSCVMTETYYGERTYTATTFASKKVICKNLKMPEFYPEPVKQIKLDKKGDEITITAGALYATDVKWYKVPKIGGQEELGSDCHTETVEAYEIGYFAGERALKSTLKTQVDEEATYVCVFSNSMGSIRGQTKVNFPVSFLRKEAGNVTILKNYGGEVCEPIEGELEPGMYFQWNYWFFPIEDTSPVFEMNGNKLKFKANSNAIPATDNFVFCELRQKKGNEDVLIATSPGFNVKYEDGVTEREIVGLVIGGLDDKMYVGQKAPTADQIYVKSDVYGIDPRVRVSKLTVTGVNDEGVIISPNPKVSIRFETTAPYYYFSGKTNVNSSGFNYYTIFYQSGPYIWGNAEMASQATAYVDVVINFDGSTGHYALDKVKDGVIPDRDIFEFTKGKAADEALNVTVITSDGAKNLGESHYVKELKIDQVNVYNNKLPAGLSLVKTGTRKNADGITEPTYALRGTVTQAATAQPKNLRVEVCIGGDPDYPNGRWQYCFVEYTINPESTLTEEQIQENINAATQAHANEHVHVMEAWQPLPKSLDKYDQVHERICKYFESDVDGNGVELNGGCFYVEREPHDFYDVEVIREATLTQPGVKKCKCAVCGVELEKEYSLNPEGHVVTIDLNLGDKYGNQTKDVDVPEGEFTVPTLQIEHPEGKNFGGWTVTSKDGKITKNNVRPGDVITVDRDMTCKAIWTVVSDMDLKITKKSLTLYDTITINFKIPKTTIDGKYHDPYLVVKQNGAAAKISEYLQEGDFYVFQYRVAPHMLGEAVTAAPHALDANGKNVTGEEFTYSVAEYCYNMLGKEAYQGENYAVFRRLLVDILLYGDAAQVYMDYKTNELAGKKLTAAQLAMGTDVTVAMSYQTVKDNAFAIVENPLANIAAAALYLEAAVEIQFKYTASDLTGLRVVVTEDAAGENVIKSYAANANRIDDKGRYYVNFGELNAAQMKKTVYATVMKGDKKVSNTYRYSIESYVESMKDRDIPNLGELLDAMMRYGQSAADYVNQ